MPFRVQALLQDTEPEETRTGRSEERIYNRIQPAVHTASFADSDFRMQTK